jgi:hypothetical protein
MRYLVENSPTLEMVVNAVIARLDNSVKIHPRRSAKNYLDDDGGSAYNGPFRLTFGSDGQLAISSGVYSVNGDYFAAPAQSIKISSAGYVLLSAEIVNETVTFKGYSIGTLPTSSNGNSIGFAPIGEVRSAGEGKYEIVQWYWGTPMLLIGAACEESEE